MKNKEEKINNEEISKEVENSIELLILYRSLYIIKQKFGLFKERINSIYDKYNIYKNNYKFDGDIKIYQIDKKDFVQVTEEVLKDINLIIIKYLNPKDIFLSKVLLEKKIKETIPIIQEILNWLTNNNNGKYSFKNYNKIFFNKKIKPFIQNINEFDIIITESNANADEQKKEAENSDFRQNFSKKAYLKVIEYNRKGHKINGKDSINKKSLFILILFFFFILLLFDSFTLFLSLFLFVSIVSITASPDSSSSSSILDLNSLILCPFLLYSITLR